MAYIAKQIFGVKVRTSDLSEQACLRAKEIFHIDSDPADIHELPYEDNEFDVALCMASLEHVVDYHKAINELLRVAAKAVVVIVPHERREVIERNIEEQIPHAHIHDFTLDSLSFLAPRGYYIIKKRISSWLLMILDYLVEPCPEEHMKGIARYRRLFIDICFLPIWKKLYCRQVASLMISLDDFFCSFSSSYLILFVVLKDEACYHQRETRKISASQIMNFTVPYHYLNKK